MPPGVQRYKRTKMVLPLRVWPDDVNGQNAEPRLAHTLDISPIGGRLGGLRNPLETGQTIMLQRGQTKSQFRVVWTRRLDPGEIQAGIESVAFEEKLWGIELPDEPGSPDSSYASLLTQDNFAIPAQSSMAETYSEPFQPPLIPPHVAQPVDLQKRWIPIAACLLLAALLLVFVGYRILANSGPSATLTLPPTVPPVVVPVIYTTPRPYGNVKVVFSGEDAGSANLLQVAEAPQGHVIYPEAPDANLVGTVGMKAVIATDGRVKEIHILKGNRILAEAAIQAVRFWRYAHHELNGEAVEAETSVTISFRGQDAVSIRFPSHASNTEVAAPKAKVTG